MPTKHSVDITFRGAKLTIIGYYTPGLTGIYSGPPEKCFPEEPAEFDIEDILHQSGSLITMLEDLLLPDETPVMELLSAEVIACLYAEDDD